MKILYLSQNNCDYMANLLLHGLRQLFGDEVVDHPRLDTVYQNGKRAPYGNSFTAFNLLPTDNIDRSDLEAKIRNQFFDLVVYAGSQVYSDATPENFPFYELLLQHRPARWAVVDGADDLGETNVRQSHFPDFVRFFCRENRGQGHPISFSIPAEKITPFAKRRKPWASFEPTMQYVYSSEASYYENYRESMFALTRRRGGWDCLRHYEIMACGCIPFFLGIQKCPERTCTSLPKKLLETIQTNYFGLFETYRSRSFTPPPPYNDFQQWYPESPVHEVVIEEAVVDELGELFWDHCRQFCTTQAEAKRFIENLERDPA